MPLMASKNRKVAKLCKLFNIRYGETEWILLTRHSMETVFLYVKTKSVFIIRVGEI